MAYYAKEQYASDKIYGVVRVNEVCFEDSITDAEIEEVFSEISKMEVVAPALMTGEALARYIEAPEYVKEKMANMSIGSSFEYKGLKICRWSQHTYNGKAIK